MKIKDNDLKINGLSGLLISTDDVKKSIEELDAILIQLKQQVEDVYKKIDGGGANSVYTSTQKIDGGGANG